MKIWNETDKKVLKRGLKRVGVALTTAGFFVISVLGLIKTAMVPGYVAVLCFITSLFALMVAFVLLYAQGINGGNHTEIEGESK